MQNFNMKHINLETYEQQNHTIKGIIKAIYRTLDIER